MYYDLPIQPFQWNTKPSFNTGLLLNSSILNNLYYFFSLNENSKIVTDLSYQNIIGNLKGGVKWNSSAYGIAPLFDGSTGYIDLGVVNPQLNINQFTISVWVNFASLPTSTLQMIWSRYDTSLGKTFNGSYLSAYDATANNNPKPRFAVALNNGVGGCAVQGVTTLITNTWYNITGTLDSNGNASVYLNGNFESSATNIGGLGNLYSNSTKTLLGARANSTNTEKYLNGSIDLLGIWLRVLSPTEIAYLSKSRKNWYNLFQPQINYSYIYQLIKSAVITQQQARVLFGNEVFNLGQPGWIRR